MKHKLVILAVLGASLTLMGQSVFGAIDTRDIERIRSKTVLEGPDFKVIDDFVKEAVHSLLITEDFSSIAQARKTLISRTESTAESAKAQYSIQFLKSSIKHVSDAMQRVGTIRDEDRRFLLTVNLLILVDRLVDELKDIELANLATAYVEDKNMVVRYWAVKCVADSRVLNSKQKVDINQRIFETLTNVVENSSNEVLKVIAEFTATVEDARGEALLFQIADVRLKAYTEWEVGSEYLDGSILKSLWRRREASGANTMEIGQRFGQLYSYLLQRYVKDLDGGAFMSSRSRAWAVGVLVEVEQYCISKALGKTQAIKKAIDRKDFRKLIQEHDRLLGSSTGSSTGRGALSVNFGYNDYPIDEEQVSSAPLTLPERPIENIGG
jgi:hypothetical protein